MPQGGLRNNFGAQSVMLLALLCTFARHASSQAKVAAKPETTAASQALSATDRQKAIQLDIDRLVELARRLKAEVDSSRKDELSMKVIRDADEVDKLARSVRGRIR